MTVGERIKKQREECGLSVIQLALMLNKARSTIYRYESDEIQDMPITVLEPLAEALRTTPEYLMGWTDDPVNYNKDDLSDVRLELIKHFDGDARRIRSYLKAEDENRQSESKNTQPHISPSEEYDPEVRIMARKMQSMSERDRKKLANLVELAFDDDDD